MSAEVAYLDASAAVKLLMQEPETAALRRRLQTWPERASAALLRVELLRTIRRAGLPRLFADARRQLASIHLIRLDDDLLDRAAELEPPSMRSLDAIRQSVQRGPWHAHLRLQERNGACNREWGVRCLGD